jgi:hypothetical protein
MAHPVGTLHQNQPFADHRQDRRVCIGLDEMSRLVPKNLSYGLVVEEADPRL